MESNTQVFSTSILYVFTENITLQDTLQQEYNSDGYMFAMNTSDCTSSFELNLYIGQGYTLNSTTGLISEDNSVANATKFLISIDPTLDRTYTLLFTPQKYIRTANEYFFFAGTPEIQIKYIPTLEVDSVNSITTCVSGQSQMINIQIALDTHQETISISYTSFMAVISSLGGIWSSLFGILVIVYKVGLWVWGWEWLRKKFEKTHQVHPHDSTTRNHDSTTLNHDSTTHNHDSTTHNHDSTTHNHDSRTHNLNYTIQQKEELSPVIRADASNMGGSTSPV